MKPPGKIILLLLVLSACANVEETPPNVLIILADDMGWNQLGCYGGPYQTPNIDALATEGMRFTDAYSAAAVCSPTRSALQTGKYPARLHLTDYIKGNPFPDSLLRQPDWQKFLPLEEITIGEVYKSYGYNTACIGKWHLSQEKKPPESLPYNPDKQGFDEYMVTYKPTRRTDPEHDPHNVDSITMRSIRFLEDNKDHPFLLIVTHNAIHDPIMESKSRITAYAQTGPPEKYQINPGLGAMVSRLDEGTGKLLDKLEELGLKDNTMVFFCSDNGGRDRHALQLPLRAGKGWLYEGGIRVPMIVRWPGRITPGSESSVMTATFDLLPTVLEMSGMPPVTHPIDGKSIAGVLLEGKQMKERNLYWHYPHYHGGSGMKPASAIRKGNYKLIEWHEPLLTGEPAWELFDLEKDLSESDNLADEQPELLEELRTALHEWRDDVDAQMPALK